MPTITLNKKIFEQLVGKELPLERLKDRISMLGTDLEKIENNEIQMEIFPNRPDMLSEQGFARAFSSFIGVKTGLRKYEVKKSGLKVIVDQSVTMRPYTACALVKNLTFTEEKIREIMQAQEKLATTHGRNRKKSAYGIYPLNNIYFPIKYIAKNPKEIQFQPLGFTQKMSADKVEELHPRGKEYKHITEGWDSYPFFIDAKNNVMCMLPYTNSEDTGKVDEKTTAVFVECTGTDLENVKLALNILVTMLADMGGEIYSLDIVYMDQMIITPDLTPQKMKLGLKYANQRLGLNLSETEIRKLLERMGYGYEQGTILIPAYRADILHPVDLIEDIAIAYGYENFAEEIPKVATIGEENPGEVFFNKVRDILVGMRLLEVKNYHLSTKEDLNMKMSLSREIIPLKNALGEHNHLRNSLLPGILKNLHENQHHEYPQNLFEIGRVFGYGSDEETGIKETEFLSVVLCHDKTDFTEIRQVLDVLCTNLGLAASVKETLHDSYISGRAGKIIINGQEIGLIGEFHPKVLENWDLLVPAVGFELNLKRIFELVKQD
ncbi:MAG TPA: phenylalanine--tRNA ligase subunit beta [Candidatus Nanoarchaeia archaeon]|nr:phenylalanine--tRNA ligase subunit beta [Candidatus Nanoarchaeia archaeon]